MIPNRGPRVQRRFRGRRTGATLVLLCLLLPVVLIVAAFAINVAHMELTRTELQIATDLATRAAGRTLAVTGDQQQAISSASRLLARNPVANKPLPLSGVDVEFGVATRTAENQRYSFAKGAKPNSVHVESNGSVQVPMLFPTMGVPVDFRPIKKAVSTRMVLDIALVLDRSGSMAFAANEVAGPGIPLAAPLGWAFGFPVPKPSRWDDAVQAAYQFLDLIEKTGYDEHVSLATYSTDYSDDIDLTEDFKSIKASLELRSKIFLGGATNIGGGMLAGLDTLSNKKAARPWATRVMVVLTDGIHNFGADPIQTARQLAAEHVIIYTVTFSKEADQSRMAQVAAIGTGKHYHATSGAELVYAFEDIARSLPTLLTY